MDKKTVHTSLQAANGFIFSLSLIALGNDRGDAAASRAVSVHCHLVVSVVNCGYELVWKCAVFQCSNGLTKEHLLSSFNLPRMRLTTVT
jgi:hypothetical protein